MRELNEETASIPCDDTPRMDVHLVQPQQIDEPLPTAIVIHDILGFNQDTKRLCRLLAQGPMPLIVAAPDLYQGLGPNLFVCSKPFKP